jgi:hypothetical protein
VRSPNTMWKEDHEIRSRLLRSVNEPDIVALLLSQFGPQIRDIGYPGSVALQEKCRILAYYSDAPAPASMPACSTLSKRRSISGRSITLGCSDFRRAPYAAEVAN